METSRWSNKAVQEADAMLAARALVAACGAMGGCRGHPPTNGSPGDGNKVGGMVAWVADSRTA